MRITHEKVGRCHEFYLEIGDNTTTLAVDPDKEAARMRALQRIATLVEQLQNA